MKDHTRAIRKHQRITVIQRRIRSASWLKRSDFSDLKSWLRARGRCATLSPYDCGRRRCGLCHPEKAHHSGKYETRKVDRISRMVEREIRNRRYSEFGADFF